MEFSFDEFDAFWMENMLDPLKFPNLHSSLQKKLIRNPGWK